MKEWTWRKHCEKMVLEGHSRRREEEKINNRRFLKKKTAAEKKNGHVGREKCIRERPRTIDGAHVKDRSRQQAVVIVLSTMDLGSVLVVDV